MTAFQLIQSIYWLALATWFGGAMFVALAWPIILATVRQEDPTLPRVLSVNVDHDHAGLLAGTIIGAIVRQVGLVQLGCAVAMLGPLIAQWFLMSSTYHNLIGGVARCTFYAGAVILLIYDRRVLWQRLWKARQEFIDNADDPEVANPIRERFNKHQRDSMFAMLLQLALLSLTIVFSSVITLP
jgi:hypothetical protein